MQDENGCSACADLRGCIYKLRRMEIILLLMIHGPALLQTRTLIS